MSSAPAGALMAMLPTTPAAPATEATAVNTLDASQAGVFSRLLQAEASLAAAVATTPLVTAPEVDAAEPTQVRVDVGAEAANNVAVAMAQAAQVSLAPLPSAPLEDSAVEISASEDGETVELSSDEALCSSELEPASGEKRETLQVLTVPIPKIESSTTIAPKEISNTPSSTRELKNSIEPEFAPDLTLEKDQVATVVDSTVTLEASTAQFEESDSESPVAKENAEIKPQGGSKPVEMEQAPADPKLIEQPVAFEVNDSRTRKPEEHSESKKAEVRRQDASVPTEEPTMPEVLLGAAGVLSAMAPREPRAASTEIEVSEDKEPQVELSIETETGFEQNARIPKSLRTDLDRPSTEDVVPADVEHASAAQDIPTDNTESIQSFTRELGEVRIIASQMPRKTFGSPEAESADATDQKEIEILPTRAEVRANAVDKNGGETDAEPAQKFKSPEFAQNFFPARESGSGEKVARQSSPEGFSFDAGQREISATAETAPFSDGGRPETIASRNLGSSSLSTPSVRTERLSGQILEAIPNPLRVTTFEIKPEGHGAIRVRISARGEGESAIWRVQIQTSDPAARSLLSDHLNELRDRLPAENVQVELRGANDVRTEVTQRENGGSRERNGEQRQSRGEEQRQPRQQKSGNFLEWLKAQE